MVPEEQLPTSSAKSDSPASKGPRRRSRRGGRRHSRRPGINSSAPVPAPVPSPETAAHESAGPSEASGQMTMTEKKAVQSSQIESTETKLPPLRPASVFRAREQPRVRESQIRKEPVPESETESKVRSITKAIEQVNEIITELKHALEEMDDVLETLEMAERQKIDDEREIEHLQRALRRLNRPRDDEPRHP